MSATTDLYSPLFAGVHCECERMIRKQDGPSAPKCARAPLSEALDFQVPSVSICCRTSRNLDGASSFEVFLKRGASPPLSVNSSVPPSRLP